MNSYEPIFFLQKKNNIPKVKIKKLIKKLILKKKCKIVIIRDINTKPKKISKKKIFLVFKFKSLPYPDIDNDNKIILVINKSILKKIISNYLLEFLKSSIISSNAFEKFIFDFHP